MPIQIPLWLENNTGSEWKKFVSDAQSAGMSVMQIMEAQQVALEKIRKSRANLGESLGNRTAQRYLNPDKEQIAEMARDFGHVKVSALEMKAALYESKAATQALGKSGSLISSLAGKINWAKLALDGVIEAGKEMGNIFEVLERRGDKAARNLKSEWDHVAFSMRGGSASSENWADDLREKIGKSSAYQGATNWGSETLRQVREHFSYGRSTDNLSIDLDDRFLTEPQREFKAMVQADRRAFADSQRSASKGKADELFKSMDDKEEVRARKAELDENSAPTDLRKKRDYYRHEAESAELTLGGDAAEKARTEDFKRSAEIQERLVAVEEHRKELGKQIVEAEKWQDSVPMNMENLTSLDDVNRLLEGSILGIRRRLAEEKLSASEEKRLMGDIQALTARGIALQHEQENVEARIRHMRTESSARPIQAEDVGTLENANRLLEEQFNIYQKINRHPLAGRDQRQEQERLIAERRGIQQQFQQQQRQTSKFIRDIGRERSNDFDASKIDDITEASVRLSAELQNLEELNNLGILTAENKEQTEQRIQEIYARQKSLVQERRQLEEQERTFGRDRQSEISQLQTMAQIQQMRDSLEDDMEQKRRAGLLTTREELKLRHELLSLRERELAVTRDTARLGIEQARAEFQRVIQKRAAQFGGQGGVGGAGAAAPGFAQEIREGISGDDVLKQLARNRARAFAAGEKKDIFDQAMRQQDAGREKPDPVLSRRYAKIVDKRRENELYRGQLAGLRRGRINLQGRGFRGVTQAEFQRAQNDIARRRVVQAAERGNLDLETEQGLGDAVEGAGDELLQNAQFNDAMRGIRNGGRPGLRNRAEEAELRGRQRRHDARQAVPQRVNNMPQLLRGVAQQQAGAFNAQHGLNQQLVQGFQQAQQSALSAMEQSDRLAEQVRALINHGNARARATKGF